MRIRPIITIFMLFLCGLFANAQQIAVDAVLDTGKMRIGEQVKLDLYLSYDANHSDIKIKWPSIGDTLTSSVSVISVSQLDTTFPNKTNSSRIFQHQQIVLSVYDSGYYSIPPLKFTFNDGRDSLYTKPMFLEVHTMPTDTTLAAVKDIKQPFEEKFNWKWYLPYVLWIGGGILAVLLTVLLILRLTRPKQVDHAEPEKPKIPPHILALQELERIRSEEVWKSGQTKQYYSEISDAIRIYIEGRFGLNALESTTDEIMTAFRSQVIDAGSKEKLQQLLKLSDLVKFAKMSPIEPEHLMTLQNAFDFVNGTKREDPMEEVPADTNSDTTPSA